MPPETQRPLTGSDEHFSTPRAEPGCSGGREHPARVSVSTGWAGRSRGPQAVPTGSAVTSLGEAGTRLSLFSVAQNQNPVDWVVSEEQRFI